MEYNIFNQVHLPLKLSLLNTTISLNNARNNGGPSGLTELLAKVNETLDIFKDQSKFEEIYILPLVFEYEPSIAAKYIDQHKKQSTLALALENYTTISNVISYEFQSLSIIQMLKKAFNEFTLSSYHHMDEEEEVLNKILKLYYNDDFLKQAQQNMKFWPSLVLDKQSAQVEERAKAA